MAAFPFFNVFPKCLAGLRAVAQNICHVAQVIYTGRRIILAFKVHRTAAN